MGNPYTGEWQKLKSIADNIQKAEQQISQLRNQLSSLRAELSNLSYDPDEDGNDRNEALRNAVYGQINAVSQRLNQMESTRQSLKATARGLAVSYSQQADAYKQKSLSHESAATTFQKLSGSRFGAFTASAAASTASQRATHYSDHVKALNELTAAAQQAASGSISSEGNTTISERGDFQNSGINRGNLSSGIGTHENLSSRNVGVGTSSGRMEANAKIPTWSGKPGESVKRTTNPTNSAILTGIGTSGISYKNNLPNFDSVSHAKVKVATTGVGMCAAADAVFAAQHGITGKEATAYRKENNLEWRADETGECANLIPVSISEEYSEGRAVLEEATPYQALVAYMSAHNYGSGDFAIYSQDPEWQRLHKAVYPEFHEGRNNEAQNLEEATPYQALVAYMSVHNYGKDDFVIYSQDPEWQRLHKAVFPAFHESCNNEAKKELRTYMNDNGYKIEDFHIYGKDSEWQRLYREAYPNFKLDYYQLVTSGKISGKFSELIQYTDYRDKPTVVNKSEFEECVKKSGRICFRTYYNNEKMGITAKEFKEKLYTDSAETFRHNGIGNRGYGDGIYITTNCDAKKDVYPLNHQMEVARDHSLAYGTKGARATTCATLASDTNLADGEKLFREYLELSQEEREKYMEYSKEINLKNGLSSYAIAKGYDGVIWYLGKTRARCDYITVLNRKKLIVLYDPDNTAYGIN